MKRLSRQLFVFPPVMVQALYATAIGFMALPMQVKFGLTSAQTGLFSTMQSAGSGVALVLCFCIFSAMNRSRVFLIAAALFGGSLIAFGFSGNVIVIYALLVLIGLLTGTSTTISNALMVDGESSRKSSFYIGILHGLWAGTSALGPFFVLLFNSDFTATFVWLGAITLASLLIFTFGYRDRLKMPMWEDKSKVGTLGKLFRTFKYKGMAVILIIGFLTTIVRTVFTIFIRSYMTTLGRDPLDGAYVLGVMLIGMMVGRMIYGAVAHKVSANKTLMLANMVSAIAFSVLLLTQNMVMIVVMMGIGAICMSINIPVMIAKAYKIIPNDATSATSFVFFGIVFGAVFGPPVIGWIADLVGMQIALFVCVAMLIPVIVLAYRKLRRERLLKNS
jgi:MFS family permease